MESESTAPLSPESILRTGLAFWASKTLLSAVEMEVFTELAKHPESLGAVTARMGLHPRGARDFLDALVALGFLLRAMSGVSHGANLAIARQFDWSGYETYVDAGTAQGDLAVQIALANPHLKGIGFDLPEVGPIFEDYALANGVADHVHFIGGSFFDEPLPRADVVLYGHILHDWNLEEKRHLLRIAHDALPEGGAVIVYDAIIDDDRSKNAFGLLMSLNMLIETEGGFDYAGADCIGWMKEAGFRETRVEHLVGPDSMVIGIK